MHKICYSSAQAQCIFPQDINMGKAWLMITHPTGEATYDPEINFLNSLKIKLKEKSPAHNPLGDQYTFNSHMGSVTKDTLTITEWDELGKRFAYDITSNNKSEYNLADRTLSSRVTFALKENPADINDFYLEIMRYDQNRFISLTDNFTNASTNKLAITLLGRAAPQASTRGIIDISHKDVNYTNNFDRIRIKSLPIQKSLDL